MKDPFIEPPAALQAILRPLAERLNLKTLPLHFHHILAAFFAYQIILKHVSPFLSARLFPNIYPQLAPKTKLNWDVHVVSLVQAIFISWLALWVMFNDEERKGWDSTEKVYGYTGAGGAVQGFAAGYFVWDLVLSITHYDIFGPGFTAHAVSALLVFMLGFRPFVNYYAPVFILFELSNPFLNFHWFFDKLKMTGGKAQLVNGLLLIFTFFSCRIVWGTVNSFIVFRDIFSAVYNPPKHIVEQGLAAPKWLAFSYLASNLTLNCLNYYWFSRMIVTLRKRFEKPEEKKEKDDVVVVEGTEVDMTTTARELADVAHDVEARKRKSRKA